ncbi:MAG: hypothetical protein CL674_04130 [Bdellovibrionaceae bacterium]|nr:hypothetical protein [Pseudobdellovibrionaceae bacterium]|tara:strand:- start:29728 stop:30228 length:501 start_codon:yes stop_codon:yes gene_type:complete
MFCPCETGKDYQDCCAKFIEKGAKPATAVELMRSRYSAFVVGEVQYLLDTHDPRSREELDVNEIEAWSKNSEWKGLNIIEITDGDKNDTDGKVEFIASFEVDGEEHHHHERADFFRKGGVWFYKDGKMVDVETFVRETPKIGRNEPCHCGSGKKYKKCHGPQELSL